MIVNAFLFIVTSMLFNISVLTHLWYHMIQKMSTYTVKIMQSYKKTVYNEKVMQKT